MYLFYSCTIGLTCLMLLVMLLHLCRSETLEKRDRRTLRMMFGLVILAAAAEWASVSMDGAAQQLISIHAAIKALELSITPFFMLIWGRMLSGYRRKPWLEMLVLLNAAAELFSALFGFIFYVDAQNVYHHGSFYFIYTLVYVVSIAMVFRDCFVFSRRYQNRNIEMLVAILLFAVCGVLPHNLVHEIRLDWMGVGVTTLLYYIYYVDLTQQVDQMTGLLNRRSYENTLQKLNYDTAVVIFDADEFKKVNDVYGHAVGDFVLARISACIREAYQQSCYCFRIGGDEFCCIYKRGKAGSYNNERCTTTKHEDTFIREMPEPTPEMHALNIRFDELLQTARREDPRIPDVSLGYTFLKKDEYAQAAIRHADELMYAKKNRKKTEKGDLR